MADTKSSVHTARAQAKNEQSNRQVAEKMNFASDSGAEVVPFPRSAVAESKAEYVAAIEAWCSNRDMAQTLSPKDVGAMPHKSRMDAQRKALILNLVHYYRKHERADVAPGVAVIIHLLSDNDSGASTVSQVTMSKLFGRSVSSIADACRRLREDQIIVMGRGRYASTAPVIPQAVASSYNHLAWLLAGAAAEEQGNLLVPPDDCQTSGLAGGLSAAEDQSSCGSGGLKTVNHPVDTASIIRPDPMQFHSITSEVEDTSLRSVSHAADGDVDEGQDRVPDDKEIVWGKGVDWLCKKSGRPRKAVQPLMGKWLKVVTFTEMRSILRSAHDSRAVDPVSYVASIVEQARKANHNVRRENGRILVFNGFEAELSAMLKGGDLQLALTRLEGRIPMGIVGIELETRVRSGVAEQVARTEEQDRRYAAARGGKPKSESFDDLLEHYKRQNSGVLA